MCLFVNLLQFFDGIMRIDLRSGQATVSHEVFDGVEVSTVVKQVCGKGVAQDMWASLLKRSHCRQVFFYDSLNQHGVSGFSFVGQKQYVSSSTRESFSLEALVLFD